MGMPQRPHVVDFSLNSGLCLSLINDLLGDKLHGYSMACDSVDCHYSEMLELVEEMVRRRRVYELLTLPNVPSAISETTVYSPSLEGGNAPLTSAISAGGEDIRYASCVEREAKKKRKPDASGQQMDSV